MYICPSCGSNRIRSAKALGYEDEQYCLGCGRFVYAIRVKDSTSSDASKAPGSASSAGASPLGEFLEGGE